MSHLGYSGNILTIEKNDFSLQRVRFVLEVDFHAEMNERELEKLAYAWLIQCEKG